MKKDAVVYYSKNNTTKETVGLIRNTGKKDIDIFDLHDNSCPDISGYGTVYIGCGIYTGHLSGSVIKFIKTRRVQLQSKKLVFFIHGLISKQNYRRIVEQDLKKYIHLNSVRLFYLGGKLDIKKQNFFIRKMMKVIAKNNDFDPDNSNTLDEQKIAEFLKLFST